MWKLLCAGMLAFATVSAADAATLPYKNYDVQTVVAAKQALIRLGYDPGGTDGKWNATAESAMNALRQANGLPPAQGFVGSSLELVHRLSPGETTLPHPGILITDPVARRSFIQALPPVLPKTADQPSRALCQGPVGPDGETIAKLMAAEPVAVVRSVTNKAAGQMTHNDDWSTPIQHTMTATGNSCIAGSDEDCRAIVSLMSKWADADALKAGVKRTDKAFDDASWVANIVLRGFVFAYADARKLVKVDVTEDAKIVDWLKRRIDDYHFIHTTGNDPFSPDYAEAGNHSLADMMAGAAFGAMVGDRSMMEPAFDNWRLSLSVMRKDGSLPNETKRGAKSLHYSTFQISQLLSTAELARAQGLDPAGPEASEGKTIQKTVSYLLDAFENFDKVTPYAKENEHPGPYKDYTTQFIIPSFLGWLPAYYARFGNDENFKRMATLKFDDRACSSKSLQDGKFPPQACTEGTPNIPELLSIWDTSDAEELGYSAFCLQGVAPEQWPLPSPDNGQGAADDQAVIVEAPGSAEEVRLKGPLVVHAAQEHVNTSGHDPVVDFNIKGTIENAPKGEDRFFFILDGNFDYAAKNFSQLKIVPLANLGKTPPAGLAACGGKTEDGFPDGGLRFVIPFTISGNDLYGPPRTDCLAAALPKRVAAEMYFLLDHFRDLATGMVKDGNAAKLTHDGVKIFIQRLAAGEIDVLP